MVAGNNFAFSQENSQKETLIVIHTDYGDITAKLYNDTPQHRDNFIKLINEISVSQKLKKIDFGVFRQSLWLYGILKCRRKTIFLILPCLYTKGFQYKSLF